MQLAMFLDADALDADALDTDALDADAACESLEGSLIGFALTSTGTEE